MKEIKIQNNKIKDLIVKKGELVLEGRELTDQIETLEAEMQAVDTKIVEHEKTIDISDLNVNADELTAQFNSLIASMDALNASVRERLIAETPKEYKEEYDALAKKKEELEEKRKKIGLSIQKYNDKIVPMVRKELEPHLVDEFDDFGNTEIKDGEVVGTIFNHIEEYKEQFRKRK